ncbi:MAG: glycoside hydrolase family 3 [Chloroflexi bacterium]|nr:glycoside hydrolase family 3 [Chloroflexota bacterium]
MLPRRHVLRTALLGAVGAVLAACGVRTSTTEPSTDSNSPAPPTPTPEPTGTPVPTGTPDAGPTVEPVSLRSKIAGLLVLGFRGASLDEAPWLRDALAAGLGGVILFDRDQLTGEDRNVASPDQLKALTDDLQAAGHGRQVIVAVDQEGGAVARLSPTHGFPAVASATEIGAGAVAAAEAWAAGIASTLAGVGINLNLAPVVDLNVNPDSPAIGSLGRSFSADPNVVVEMATAEIDAHRVARVRTALKHFPGIGSATTNTDFGVADVTATWTRSELEPFARLIATGDADLVMAGHVVNGQLDRDRPASLSRPTVTGVLRGQLGWTGPVVTDDLQAAAIEAAFGRNEAIVLALEAGCDLLLFANQQVFDPAVFEAALDAVEAAVASARLTEARIDESIAQVASLFAAVGD